jgi:AAA15 family ATPase/GTPase
MPELLLDSLEIKGYRCFEHLTIEKLGRVNLIVGKNNVGKTALLEALEIYASYGSSYNIYESLISRNECPTVQGKEFEDLRDFWAIRYILPGRPVLDKPFSFSIGKQGDLESVINFTVEPPANTPQISFDKIIHQHNLSVLKISTTRPIHLFDTLVKDQNLIIENLKQIFPDLVSLKDVTFDYHSNLREVKITPFLIFEDEKESIPIGSLGEGTNHFYVIFLALIRCKDGILLIDEIENGLHYSILPDVWKLIFKTAKDLNVQVFATTHSKDCIEAFTQAAIDDEESEGMLIRLERNKDDKIIAKTIEEERLADAINYGAEVR